MKAPILFLSFLLCLSVAIAQNKVKVSGTISTDGKPVEKATVSLLRAKDSVTMKLAVTTKNGEFSFEQVPDGKHLVSVTAVGHQKAFSGIFELAPEQQTIHLPGINLNPVSKDLA